MIRHTWQAGHPDPGDGRTGRIPYFGIRPVCLLGSVHKLSFLLRADIDRIAEDL